MQHSSSSARRSALGIGVSLAAHVAAFLLIPHLPRPAVEQFHTAMVEFEVSPPTPEPQPKPEPEPEPAPEPAPAPVVQAQAPPDARPAAPLPQATPERSPEETPKPAEPEPGPLDLGELADLGGGASVPVGYSGSGTGSGSGRAPVGRPAAAQPPVRRPAPVPVAPAGPVAVKDLRAAPRAPALD